MRKGGDAAVMGLRDGPYSCSLRMMLISVFDGIGGLRRSLQRLQLQVILTVCIEVEAPLRRTVRAAFPGVVEFEDIRLVTRRQVEQVVKWGHDNGANLCAYGGGFPCQDVSKLSVNRVGITGSRSSLFLELGRVAQDVEQLCDSVGMQFLGLAECVRMDVGDELAVKAALGWHVLYHCPSGASLARRPRTFWTSVLPLGSDDVILEPTARGHRMTFLGEVEPEHIWCTPGWRPLCRGGSEWRLPTFTCAIPRTRPAAAAPGLRDLTAEA